MSRSRRFAVTIHNYTENQVAQIIEVFETCVIGREVAPETGTPHLQIYIETENGRTFTAMLKDLPAGAHIEKAKTDRKINRKHCIKEGNVAHDHWAIPSPLDGKELYPWQIEVLALLATPPDDRSIYWYWEPAGNTGKTSLAKQICLRDDDAIHVSGKSADMKFAVAKCGKYPKVILMDLSRSLGAFASYEGIASIKDGIFFCGKYESKMVMGNCPHFIVFANFEPDMAKLSADRWVVRKIETDEQLHDN